MFRCRSDVPRWVRPTVRTDTPNRHPEHREHTVSGFKRFLLRGNLVDLAVAFVIGAAFGARTFTVHHSVFAYGDFINAVIAFVIMAAVIYFFVVVPFTALLDRYKK